MGAGARVSQGAEEEEEAGGKGLRPLPLPRSRAAGARATCPAWIDFFSIERLCSARYWSSATHSSRASGRREIGCEKLPVETRYDASAEPSTQSPAVRWASVGSGLHSNGG